MEPEVSPIRQQIDEIRSSKAFLDNMHPSHEKAMETISKLYAQEYPEVETPTEQPTETLANPTSKVESVGQVDNPLTPEEGQALTSLQQEWGASWQANVEAAQGVAESLSKDLGMDVFDFLEDSRLGSHPTVVRAMFEWSQGRPGPDVTPAEAKAILDMARKSDLYLKGDSRARDTLLDVVSALYRVVHPEG
jgi:hypothetical protein